MSSCTTFANTIWSRGGAAVKLGWGAGLGAINPRWASTSPFKIRPPYPDGLMLPTSLMPYFKTKLKTAGDSGFLSCLVSISWCEIGDTAGPLLVSGAFLFSTDYNKLFIILLFTFFFYLVLFLLLWLQELLFPPLEFRCSKDHPLLLQ